MDPTLEEGDRVVVVKVLGAGRGDLVVFRHPLEPRQNVVKRIVGRPGERVAIRAGIVYVDGAELGETYLRHPNDRDPSVNYPETLLGEGELFVLGDNRAASQDSRRFGPIDVRSVIGRAVLTLFPTRRL